MIADTLPPVENRRAGIFRRAAVSILGRVGVFAKFAASLGQTLDEMEASCGPRLRADMHRGTKFVAWERPGMNIIAAMSGGKAVVLLYMRQSGLFPAEIRTLLDASAHGSHWNQADGNTGRWQRADGGATALLSDGKMLFIHDLDAGARIVAEMISEP